MTALCALPEGVDAAPDRTAAQQALLAWVGGVIAGPDESRPPLFILTGRPGGGKTHFATRLVESLTAEAVAKMANCAGCGGTGWQSRLAPATGHMVASHCGCCAILRPCLLPVLSPLDGGRAGLADLLHDEAQYDMDARSAARMALARYASTRLLVLDEFGGERDGQATYPAGLLRLLDARAKRSTLIITNLSTKEIAARYEPRIVSRLLGEGFSAVAQYGTTDWRRIPKAGKK